MKVEKAAARVVVPVQDQMVQMAELYSKVWQEPPWNETNWEVSEVLTDLLSILGTDDGLLYAAVLGDQVVGFTAGWPINRYEFFEKSGTKIGRFFKDDEQAFYIAELGCDCRFRGQGIGKQLSLRLINDASEFGYHRFTLRTHLMAGPARTLYASLGFHETRIIDQTYPDRSYWVRVDD